MYGFVGPKASGEAGRVNNVGPGNCRAPHYLLYVRRLSLLAEVLVHIGCGLASVTHGQDDGSSAANDVTSCKESRNIALHIVADGDSPLAAQLQSFDGAGQDGIG